MKALGKSKVLIIDDEPSILNFIHLTLEANGFEAIDALNGKVGLQKAHEMRPDLIILDYGLPDMDGIEVLKSLRKWYQVPILFLTVRDDDAYKVAALDCGADDYLTKPFSVPELLARLRVALRHAKPPESSPNFKSGPLEIDNEAHLVKIAGREVHLTTTEYDLLGVLILHAGKVVPHSTILREVWGPHSLEHFHYLRVYFGQIRKKFEKLLSGAGDLIITESGVGYRIRTDEIT